MWPQSALSVIVSFCFPASQYVSMNSVHPLLPKGAVSRMPPVIEPPAEPSHLPAFDSAAPRMLRLCAVAFCSAESYGGDIPIRSAPSRCSSGSPHVSSVNVQSAA